MQFGVIIGLVFGVIIAFFAFLNTATVTVNYFFGHVESSVALIVLVSAFAGALMVGFLGLITQIRVGFTIWNYKNKSQHLTKEVEALKQQKQELTDDLSFLQAECEMMQKEKENLEAAVKDTPEYEEAVETLQPEESTHDL